MKTIEFETYVENKISVIATRHEESGDGWNEPYISAHITIDDIELPADLKDKILDEYTESFRDEAAEMF